jgi:hypothetical protein
MHVQLLVCLRLLAFPWRALLGPAGNRGLALPSAGVDALDSVDGGDPAGGRQITAYEI